VTHFEWDDLKIQYSVPVGHSPALWPNLENRSLICRGVVELNDDRVVYTGFRVDTEHSQKVTVLVTVPST
jgi:hypothetical protein